MKKTLYLAGILLLLNPGLFAQQKEYSSLSEALMSGMSLRGDRGPSGDRPN